MFAYVLRRVLATIPLLIITLYLVHVGVSATTNPLADFYLCLPRCQQGFDRIVEVYNLDVSIWVRPIYWFQDAARGDLGFSSAIGVLLSLSERLIALALSLFFVVLSPRLRRSKVHRDTNDKSQ